MALFDNAEAADYKTVVEKVIATANLGCVLNLHQIAENWVNVELEHDKIIVQLRNPDVTVHISSQGELSGYATSEDEVRTGIRQIARRIQKKGYDVKLRQMKFDVRARVTMPFRVRVGSFALYHRNKVIYEPELHDYAELKIPELEAHLSIHDSGEIEITAPTRAKVDEAAKHIHPRVMKFRRE